MFSILLIWIVAILAIGMLGTVNADDQTITTSSSGGLKTAINDVGIGQTVYMESGVYSGNDNNGIIINKSLTIQGKGNNVVIDAKGTNRIFTIESGASVTLKNLKLINGNAPNGYAGAIFNNKSYLVINDCIFTNNQANTGSKSGISYTSDPSKGGGAIYNFGGTLTISGSTFSNNQAKHIQPIYDSMGGAIYNDGGTLIISGSIFSNNQAKVNGGAIYNNNLLTISGSTFSNNQANSGGGFYAKDTSRGGAIYNNGNTLTIGSSTFSNNQAKSDGGAIYATVNSEIKIDKTTFSNNIVTSTNTYNAIYYTGTKLSKTGVTISPTEGTKVNAGTTNPGGANNPSGTSNQGNGTLTIKLADLKITKITKKGSYRYVFVKNIGKAAAGKNTLGVYIGKRLIKKVSVKSIGIGKTLKVTVAIPKKYMTKKYKNKVKTFKVDIKNVVKESNKKNNSFKVK